MADHQHERVLLCVLAGGASRRFAGSKLRLTIDDEPILARQARRLRTGWCNGAARCWLSVAPQAGAQDRGQPQAAPPAGSACYDRIVYDDAAFAGPLAGIARVLRDAARFDVAAFVPADMPMLSPIDLMPLRIHLRRHPTCVAVMSRWCSGKRAGRVEPFPLLCHPAAMLQAITRMRSAGARSVTAIAHQPGVVTLSIGGHRAHAAHVNINRPGDLAGLGDVHVEVC